MCIDCTICNQLVAAITVVCVDRWCCNIYYWIICPTRVCAQTKKITHMITREPYTRKWGMSIWCRITLRSQISDPKSKILGITLYITWMTTMWMTPTACVDHMTWPMCIRNSLFFIHRWPAQQVTRWGGGHCRFSSDMPPISLWGVFSVPQLVDHHLR
jgi:hypothetical protein